ncbi:hypothetical protein ABE10_02435, partial [Bacillus toyonensis]|nr:hypothetical protein [Bacillus toyonensis]
MAAEDPVELRAETFDRGTGAMVHRVGEQLDRDRVALLERVPQEQSLGGGIDLGSLRFAAEPGVAD